VYGKTACRVGEEKELPMDWHFVWLALLTLALAAHMVKDSIEFKKIQKLEEELSRLKK
jgi:hypothetical protein